MLNNDTRTNDAYVNADYTIGSTKSIGLYQNIHVADNQRVKEGKHWPRWMTVTTK